MTLDSTQIGDQMATSASYQRGEPDVSWVRGHGVAEIHGPDGELKAQVAFTNLITEKGEEMYALRGARAEGEDRPANPTGMQLGTGNTAPLKTGAGAASIQSGTLLANSLKPLQGTPSTSRPAQAQRVTYIVQWAAGEATAATTPIAEVTLVNQAVTTQTAAPLGSTIARALLSPPVFKGAADSLTVTWHHDIGGSGS